MTKPNKILYWTKLIDLIDEFGEVIETEDGGTYFRIPVWFESLGHGEYTVHTDKLPEDLSMFICKAGLGGHSKIKKVNE